MVIISKCKSGWFMSWLYMWSFDLRHQRHLVDGWSCFDYDIATGSLKCHKLDTTWSSWRWLCDQDGIICPRYFRRLTQGMRCDKILVQGSGNIKEGVPDDFLHASILTWVTD